ncbi:penicillin-binding protein activator LpoB [Leptospira levettii]|uniref:penicillin-binding protein activator LpoB n=1 Tax=Leptospira levettii TaxID=2023178 RepID=UPI00223E847C|nr:penicillin-binding protein activator LpoB [Leptospira levettii]MCW7471893.1 penicillin-binding protein activator LpoB [Leptospira levettii]
MNKFSKKWESKGKRLRNKGLHGRGDSLGGGSSSPPKSGGDTTANFLPNSNSYPKLTPMHQKFLIFFVSFILVSCSTGASYQKPENAKATKQWGVVEVKETVKSMSHSLSVYYKTEMKTGFLEWRKLQNSTSEHIDTKLITNEILNQLTKDKIPFVDTSVREDATKEMAFGKTGMVSSDSRLAVGKFKSPSHQIKGEINEVVNFESGTKIQYITVTLFLVSLETNQIVWSEQTNFLKKSRVEGYGF